MTYLNFLLYRSLYEFDLRLMGKKDVKNNKKSRTVIDLFTNLYNSIKDENDFLTRIRFYSIERFLIRVVANVILPIYLRLTANMEEYEVSSSTGKDKKIIVSLTSFPARINRVWIVIECLLRQTYSPDKIILWLSKEQFEGRDSLPQKLLILEKRGLEIIWCNGDLRSHKKYYYAVKNYQNDILITVDDDIIYPTTLISRLINLYKKNPNSICCNRALRIKKNGKKVRPYEEWEYVDRAEEPSSALFFTSGGGTLFPPGALPKEVLNKKVFLKYCKYADDIWLNLMAQMNNTKVAKTNTPPALLPIFNKSDANLSSINLHGGFNDKQLSNLKKYYKSKNSKALENVYF